LTYINDPPDTRVDWPYVLTARSSALGAITFVIPGAGAAGMKAKVTLAIIDAGHGGDFKATADTGEVFGPWSGSSLFGPVIYDANTTLRVTGTGVLPSQTFTLQLLGTVDYTEKISDWHPIPTGQTALIGTDPVVNIPSKVSASGNLDTYGPFASQDYQTLRLSIQNTIANTPLDVTVTWRDRTNTFEMGVREYVVPGRTASQNGRLERVQPHLGEQFTVGVSNTSGTSATYSIAIEQSTSSASAWGGADSQGTYQVSGNVLAPAAEPGTTLLQPVFIYSGLATVEFDPGYLSRWILSVLAQNPDTTRTPIIKRTNSGRPGQTPIQFIAPAKPITIAVANLGPTSVPINYLALAYDLHRAQ
jgi:hypothetical protein